jgi:hypothetical protein
MAPMATQDCCRDLTDDELATFILDWFCALGTDGLTPSAADLALVLRHRGKPPSWKCLRRHAHETTDAYLQRLA